MTVEPCWFSSPFIGLMPASKGFAGASDIDGVKAASNAFHIALPVLDDGTIMKGV